MGITERAAPPSVLTIAGSDSGGGAGVQADLLTFVAYGVHGLSAITAVTAQNTRVVTAVHRIPVRMIERQLDALFDDFAIAAAKIGMLGDAATVRAVARALARRPLVPVILDPVMVASSGDRLLAVDALESVLTQLLPRATLVTPNLPEAALLTAAPVAGVVAMRRAAKQLLARGAGAVLVKGGHLRRGPIIDLFVDAQHEFALRHARLPVVAHGTGCTLSAAIAAQLALGRALPHATRDAVDYVHGALRHATRPGRGDVSILNHCWRKNGN